MPKDGHSGWREKSSASRTWLDERSALAWEAGGLDPRKLVIKD